MDTLTAAFILLVYISALLFAFCIAAAIADVFIAPMIRRLRLKKGPRHD